MSERNRCRLMLAASPETTSHELVSAVLGAGDIAGVILHTNGSASHFFESFCETLVPAIQSHDIAALIADDSQLAGRSNADGHYVERERSNLNDILARFSPQKIVGCGGMLNRDQALKLGETGIDFLAIGKLGRDTHPEPHKKNMELGEWWSEFVELPCIILGGNSIDSVVDVAKTGADFVLLEQAVFHEGATVDSARDAIQKANDLLDKYAPALEEAED